MFNERHHVLRRAVDGRAAGADSPASGVSIRATTRTTQRASPGSARAALQRLGLRACRLESSSESESESECEREFEPASRCPGLADSQGVVVVRRVGLGRQPLALGISSCHAIWASGSCRTRPPTVAWSQFLTPSNNLSQDQKQRHVSSPSRSPE